jgi:glyoxylase-like metal-dependent hydrolase (beta-lactamase superfamily II)
MDKITVPAEETVPLEHVGDGLIGLRTYIVNVFAIVSRADWILVDAGIGGQSDAIESWARDHVSTSPPAAIVLTHAHFDHVGSLGGLLRKWHVPVYAHADELPYVTGAVAYPPPDPSVGGGLMARLSGLYPRGPFDFADRVRPLAEDHTVPGLPEWRWIETPGHSPGHVSFFRDRDRALVVGDAFCTTKQESFLSVATQRPELHGPPAYFTIDWNASRESVRRLAALEPEIVAPGHGRPMAGPGMKSGLHTLADQFDEVARPEHGRYVERPVRTT